MEDRKFETIMEQETIRLDRIEQKIDKLSDVVVQIAKVEEKLLALENDKRLLLEKMIKHDELLTKIIADVEATKTTVSGLNKMFWIVITTTISAVAAGITSILK